MTSAEYAAILLTIVTLSLNYCNALRCYECGSFQEDFCSTPLDTKHADVTEDECHNVASACMKSKVIMGGKLHKHCTCTKLNTFRLSVVSYDK